MKRVAIKVTVFEALQNAASIVEELSEEMCSWRDNMPENLQSSERGERVTEAADALESADLDEIVSRLAETIEDKVEGREADPGCVAHVTGKPCARCGWNGKLRAVSSSAPQLIWYDPPTLVRFVDGSTIECVARTVWGGQYWHYRISDEKHRWCRSLPSREAIQQDFEERCMAKWLEQNTERARQPPVLPPEDAVAPLPQLEPLLKLEVEITPMAKKRPSRADRLAEAMDLMAVGVGALTAAIDEIEDIVAEGVFSEAIDEIREIIGEIEGIKDELEGVEFPGMFG